MSRTGMVTKIQTRIRSDPFSCSYDLVGRELGRGKFAVVRQCVEKATGKQFAAKFQRKRRKGGDCRPDILNEIAVLELARPSRFLVDLHQVFETGTEIILVLECAGGGELFQRCVADGDEALTEGQVARLARQILRGVAFLHRNNVVHLDLKPQNVLLTSARPLGDVRIVDFGLSRHVDSITEVREILGTPEYVAPEVLSYEPISTATDMWSVGVMTYVMLTGQSPFLGEDKQETFLNVSQVDVDYSEDTLDGVSALAVDFIKTLLVKNPRKRATAEECLAHPWLTALPLPRPLPRPASSLDEPEASQSESEPESPAPSPDPDLDLDLIDCYLTCPVQGGLKAGRDALSFGEPPFRTRPEIQQEVIC